MGVAVGLRASSVVVGDIVGVHEVGEPVSLCTTRTSVDALPVVPNIESVNTSPVLVVIAFTKSLADPNPSAEVK